MVVFVKERKKEEKEGFVWWGLLRREGRKKGINTATDVQKDRFQNSIINHTHRHQISRLEYTGLDSNKLYYTRLSLDT